MHREELLDQVRRLHGEGKSPKQIARALGKRPAEVAPLVRAVAAERRSSGESEVVGCWINTGWSKGLGVAESRHWPDEVSAEDDGAEGMVSALVARRHRWDKVSVCGYLVDVYCLGVKNTTGPEITDELGLRRFLRDFYSAYPNGWQDAPIELVQHLVFGAVEYARKLGFEPAVDLAPVAGHLGTWEGPSAITFGKDGKPFYVAGPYDNPNKVIRTLESTVGPPPKFDYVLVTGF